MHRTTLLPHSGFRESVNWILFPILFLAFWPFVLLLINIGQWAAGEKNTDAVITLAFSLSGVVSLLACVSFTFRQVLIDAMGTILYLNHLELFSAAVFVFLSLSALLCKETWR